MTAIKGKHKCPVCGSQTTFTITDLDQQICDSCEIPISVGAPVRKLRTTLTTEDEITKLVKEGVSTPDHKGVLHSNSVNDFQTVMMINYQLLNMLKESIGILSDNKLMVGENKEETDEYILYAEETLKEIQLKYLK